MEKDSGTKGTPSQGDEEIKIEDLPNREPTSAESEAAKGGYSSLGGIYTLGGLGDTTSSTSNDNDFTMKEEVDEG